MLLFLFCFVLFVFYILLLEFLVFEECLVYVLNDEDGIFVKKIMEYFEFNLLKYVVIEKKYIYNLDYLNYKLRIEKMKCKNMYLL